MAHEFVGQPSETMRTRVIMSILHDEAHDLFKDKWKAFADNKLEEMVLLNAKIEQLERTCEVLGFNWSSIVQLEKAEQKEVKP